VAEDQPLQTAQPADPVAGKIAERFTPRQRWKLAFPHELEHLKIA
jgi:hypothetical protein